MFSSLKIGTKLLLTIGLTFVLGFGVLIFIIGTNVNTDMVESISKMVYLPLVLLKIFRPLDLTML